MRRLVELTGILLLIYVIVSPNTYALQSANYKFDESVLGAGGLNQSSSSNYQVNSSLGDLGVGHSSSSNYQVEAGSETTPDPTLSFQVESNDVGFGDFTAATATMSTASFSVLNYTSYGYVVQIAGNPPSNGDHTINAMSTTGTSQAGIDQFGINLVKNSSPKSIGADPDNGDFGAGQAAPNYNTANEYRYVDGETIASAPKSSGKTTYTISYLVNVAGLTPGGQYTSHQTIIVTGTY